MAEEWFIHRDGQKRGPYAREELVNMAQSGQLQAADKVLSSLNNQWVTAGSVDGLIPARANSAPPSIETRTGVMSPELMEEAARIYRKIQVAKAAKRPSFAHWYGRRFRAPILQQCLIWLGLGFIWIPLFYLYDTTGSRLAAFKTAELAILNKQLDELYGQSRLRKI